MTVKEITTDAGCSGRFFSGRHRKLLLNLLEQNQQKKRFGKLLEETRR